jgi:hypothetical protein
MTPYARNKALQLLGEQSEDGNINGNNDSDWHNVGVY